MRSSRRLALVLVVAVVAVVAGGASAFASGSPPPQAQDEDCPGGGYDPVATPVAINSVPVVVESTVDEYFVLYARSDADAQSWEIPVAVVRGEAGTTTLAENVEALPVERYRVEKFLVSDPADVDGDCVNDITELGDPVGRNPVHSAPLISFSDGVASIPDLETFLQTAPFRDSVNTSLTHAVVDSKFILLGRSSERPGLVFINIHTHQIHAEFFYATGLGRGDDFHGNLHYDARMVAPDGSLGAWYLWFQDRLTFTEMDRFYALMAASVSAFDNNVYVYIPAYKLDWFETQRQQYEASRIDVVFDDDLSPDARLEFLNPGVGYGRLRVMDPDGRPHPREVVIYEAVPNELPRVAGIITTVRQAPLSHVNLRAVQDDVPNAYVRDVLDDPDVAALVGGFVRYEVTESGWSLRAATPDEVDEHYESARPSQTQTPPRDLSVTSVTPLSDVHFEDWTAFGVKAANVAELGRLGFTAGTVPEGFAIPFYFYDEFMRANGFHARVDEMLADPDFQADFDVQDDMLDDLRDDIKDADSPQWIIDALTEMHATFPAGTSLRYRSSTNNEDLPGFNGAGLYDSKTQDPDETADDGIDKSLKGVFASLWNFRAFTERDFHRIDHPSAAMGVLVHPNYSDELANGVAVSFDPFYDLGGLSRYYVNTQIGEDLVTNPEAHSVPEALLLIPDGGYVVLSTSNQVVPNELLMSDSQITQLTQHLTTIHDHFEALYRPAAGEPFAIEIEFKITAEDILAIKQARPWIFTVTDVNEAPAVTGTTKFTYRENGTAAVHTYRATDPEKREITWSLSGPDGGDFAVSETGVLSFASPPDYESPADSGADNVYEVSVVARDDAFNSASLSVTVTVTDVNEGPEISGQSTFTIAENDGLSNASYTGFDPEGGAVTRWTVGGRDGGDFNITQGGTVYFRNLPDYERPADSNRDNVYEVAVRAYDGRVYGSFDVTVTVTDVNESPEIGSRSRDSFTQPENRTSRLYTYSATDPERSTVTWSVAGTDGRLFTIDERGQFSFNESSPPDFDTPADAGGDNIYNVTIQARDPEFNTASLAVTVTVTEVNEGPVISRQGNAPGSVSENHPTTQVLAIYTASDPERPSVRVTGWSVSGTDGGDFVIDAVGELRFRIPPDYERPADANRDNVYELTIRASDGRYTGSLKEVQTVTVTDVNEPPTITTTSRTAFIQQENRASNLYTFRATDPEGSAVTWTAAGTDGRAFTMDERGALSFSNPPDFENPADAGRDNVYNVTVQARDTAFNIASVDVVVTVGDHNEGVEPTISTRRPPSAFRENATSAVYTFRASDPQRDLIAWSLRGTDAGAFTFTDTGTLMFRSPPDFENPTDSDRDNEYELEVVAADGHGNSDSLTFTVAVTDHNEGVEPTISTRRPPSAFRENATSAVYTFRASDPQRDLIAWSLRGTDAGAFTFTDTGTLMFRSPPDFENPTDSDRDNEYELEVVAADGHSNSDSLTFTVAVTDVNEGPEIRLEGAATSSVPENHPDTGVLADYTATDPENPNAGIFRWSTSGRDGGDFVISELGELRFRSSPDYERPADSNRDNIYEVTVRASDGRSYGTLEEPLIVTVTEVNEAPVITTKSRTEFTLRENSTSILYTYRATDQDNDDTIMWSVQGTDGEDFAIHNGILTLRLLADFEIPVDADGDNVYEITVVAADQGGLRDIVDAVIIITDQPEGPVIAGRSAFTVTENYDIAQELESYTATDAKDNRPVLPQWSVSGRDGGDFVIDRVSGALAFRNTPDYDRPADSDRDNIYEVTIRAHDSRAYGNLNVTVTVTSVNESAPAVTGRTSHTVRENTASAIYTYRASDADLNDTIAWSTGGDDGQLFEMSDRGALSFRAEPDFENPRDTGRDNVYELEVVATDQQGLRGTLEVAVTVTELNEGPVVSGTATFTIDENQDLPNATYTAEDPEATGGVTTNISWRISGRDGGDFAIDRETGVLTFRTPPDYERPADANRDNVYEVTVRAYDGRNYGDFDVVVTVTPVNEPPAVTGRDSLTSRENTPVTTRLYTYRGIDPEGADIAWSLGGDDAGDFEISEQGVLTFAAPPDFDSPRGSGTDGNEYLVTVQARDDQANTGELPVTVTVTDQNEGAVVTGQDAISVEENRDPTITVAAYSAVDPEGEAITRWSLAGSDANDFTINENGDLTFRSTPDYDRPADSNRDNEYHLTVRAYDGRTYGNLDVTISVRNQNEHAPVIRSGSRTSFTYREEATSAVYTYSATDGDKDDVIAWSTAGPDGNLFEFNDRGGLIFTEAPDYENPQDSGADNEYELNVVATDSGALTASLAVTVTVTEVNEGSEITGITTYSIIEGEDLVGATFTARDPEEPAAAVTSWMLVGSDAGDFTITETGQNSAQLTFRNTPDYDRPADSNRDNEYLVTVRVSDGHYYGSRDVTVTVTDQNEHNPVVSGRDSLSVRENTTSTLYTYSATDMDRGATITWSVSGTDGDDFTISEEGALSFNSNPNYEHPADSNSDNVYELAVVASDGSNEGTLDVTVTITEVNEGPEISGRDTLTVNENHEAVVATYSGTDPEDTSADITRWSVSGRDGGDFTISENGELSFRNPPDFEGPADSDRDNEYEVTVRASDGRVYGTYDISIAVEPVDEAPEFQRSSRTSFTYPENRTSALYTYRATDPEGAVVAWSLSGDDAGDFEIIEDGGVLTFREPPDFDEPADNNEDNEYEVTVVATDQTGHAANMAITVTVTDANEGPELTGRESRTVSENFDDILATYTARDPENPDLEITRWSVTGRDGGDFTINEAGELNFRNPPDFERPADSNRDNEYEVTVRASDGRVYGTLSVTVTVEAVDEAPEFRSGSQDSFAYQENGTSAIYTYRATDPEASDVTWGLSGTDSSAFSISETGALAFNNPPDYESPTDSGRDNVYLVTIEASDDQLNTARLDLTVTVTNVTDLGAPRNLHATDPTSALVGTAS